MNVIGFFRSLWRSEDPAPAGLGAGIGEAERGSGAKGKAGGFARAEQQTALNEGIAATSARANQGLRPKSGGTSTAANVAVTTAQLPTPRRVDALAQIYLDSLKGPLTPFLRDYDARVHRMAEDVHKPVLDVAFARQALAALIETPEVLSAIRSHVQREHADVFEAARDEGKRHNRVDEKLRQIESLRSGFEASTLQHLRDAVTSEQAVSNALRHAAPEDPRAYTAWVSAVRSGVEQLRGLSGEPRTRALEALEADLRCLAPASAYAPSLAALRQGGDDALPALLGVIDASAERAHVPTVSRLAPRGVRAVAMPTVSESALYRWSGDMWFPVALRNMGSGGGVGLDIALREIAERKAHASEPMRSLEITAGLPLNALPLADADQVRVRGDFLVYNNSRHEAPTMHATVVTPKDRLADWIEGRGPEEHRVWREVNSMLRADWDPSPGELRAKRDALVQSKRLAIHEGDAVDVLLKLYREGQRFDLAVCFELAATANRLQLLQALQAAMAEGGRAFVPLRWWSPVSLSERSGVEDHAMFDDVVKTAQGDVPLAEMLAQRHPEAFELRHGAGVAVLVVKGTKEPVNLPAMDAHPTGETVRHGFPVLRWFALD